MPTFSDDPDAWESYYTLVDDCPASITLDFAVGERAPIDTHPQLLAVLVHMNDPGEHGMGDGQDPEALRHVEQQIVSAFETRLEAIFVGRVRSQGVWQLYFYGREDQEEQAGELLSGFSGWKQELHSKEDSGWDMYFQLLFPDRERMQWIQDKKVCEALIEQGDPLLVARRVDHYAYFASAKDRQSFLDSVEEKAFQIAEVGFEESQEELAYSVRVHRDDMVELDTIHEVVMDLVEAAEEFEGLYDGWETSVMAEDTKKALPN